MTGQVRFTPESSRPEKAMDGALDHILEIQTSLTAAQLALFEIRQTALMHVSTEAVDTLGGFAGLIVGIVDAALPDSMKEMKP